MWRTFQMRCSDCGTKLGIEVSIPQGKMATVECPTCGAENKVESSDVF